MRKYRLPPIRDEPWDGDEKAKILVMNIYEMEAFLPKGNDKTAGSLRTRVFTVLWLFCRLFLTPTKQITTKQVFVVSDHYGFVVISVFCRLYLQLTELRESRHEPLSTSLCLVEKIKNQMDGFRGPL